MSASDAIIRALGADPAVYRPMARAQARILSRRTRLARGAGKIALKGITPFQLRCFLFAIFSVMMLGWIVGSASPIFGVALILTAGTSFLLLDLLFDKFDVLADADEYQVIASHPHDAWSVILAKLVSLGRSIAALAACAFLIPAIGAGFAFHSVWAAVAFAAAAAALSVAVSAGGMLIAALLVAAGGRRALLRFLPAAHTAYLVLYLGVIATRGALSRVAVPRLESLGWIQWALPSVWFAAPVELVTGHAGPTTVARGSLALGSFALLLPLSAHWVRTRFDERILEPVRVRAQARPRRVAVRRQRDSKVPPGSILGLRAYWRILRAHLRSDTTVRNGMLMALLMPAMMVASQIYSMRMRAEGVVAMTLTFLVVAETFLTRSSLMSSRPAATWFVMVSPRARLPYAGAVVTAVRLAAILPVLAAGTIYSILAGTGPMWIRLAFVTLLALLADSMLLMLRLMSPDLPFSLPIRSKRPFRWSTLLGWAGMFAGCGALLLGFIFLERWSPIACLIPVVYAAGGWVGVGYLSRRAVRKQAISAEAIPAV